MITSNKKEFTLTLKAVNSKDKLNELVVKENGVTSLISEDKTLYYFLNDKPCLRELGDSLEAIIKSNKYDLNVNVESFASKFKSEEAAFQKVVETIMFAAHKEFEMKEKQAEPKSINFLFDKKFNAIYETSAIKMEYLNFARDLQDLPPNVGTSVEIANRIAAKAKEIKEIKVTVYDKKQIESMGMGLLLSVNAGSSIDPRVVVLEYNSDSSQKKTALVGKGITFDTGGYNLKPSNFLDNMKFDMSGAAIVSSTVMALAKAKAKCNVVSIGLLTDNRIGGKATLTESVIKSMNGKTVEITNTDAEGRLVLADGITYAVRQAKADRAITVATLTGAIAIALGRWFTGTFSKFDEFHTEFENASKKSQEPIWRQPVIGDHLKAMQCSKIADLANSEPGREAGSSTAAAFLDSFAEGKEYIHLDIAATADANKRGRAPMLKTMFELLKK
ncbi:M17 family metallopeptidase [Spiroplasma cantharicola]|uniref:Probable cytosol aminopeptidase n=1 Tax=Spiroplasma cantharicola TaxID=362837 RepID=A0A0M5KCI2_9MOLU|nr:M17 family metallopeptidase [Spiroplasma cantharicola]ALD66863.1 leucyl aminopeptidase [Spiroplasma cantharicola]